MSEPVIVSGASGAPGRVVIIEGESYLYDTPIVERDAASVPDFLSERWLGGILAHIDDKFIPGWAEVLATETTYREKMAIGAALGYTTFLNPQRLSRRARPGLLSTRIHRMRILAAYDKLKAAIDFLTDEGRELFEQKLRDSQDAYREGEALPLSLTGDYGEQLLGAATRQWIFLAGSLKFLTYKWQTDTLEGKFPPPLPFLVPVPKWDIARKHQNLLVQGGVFSLYHKSVTKVHERLDELLVTWLSDDYLPPPDSFIRFQAIPEGLGIRTVISFLPPE